LSVMLVDTVHGTQYWATKALCDEACPLPGIQNVHYVVKQGVVHLRYGVDVFVYGVGKVVHGIVIGHLRKRNSMQ
jgi:hypothetical protein